MTRLLLSHTAAVRFLLLVHCLLTSCLRNWPNENQKTTCDRSSSNNTYCVLRRACTLPATVQSYVKDSALSGRLPSVTRQALHVLTSAGLSSSILCLSLSGNFCFSNLKWPVVPSQVYFVLLLPPCLCSNCPLFAWRIASHL